MNRKEYTERISTLPINAKVEVIVNPRLKGNRLGQLTADEGPKAIKEH